LKQVEVVGRNYLAAGKSPLGRHVTQHRMQGVVILHEKAFVTMAGPVAPVE